MDLNRSDAARRRAEQIRRSRARAQGSSAGDRAMVRLVICGAVFVLLVLVKLLFPETVDSLAQSAGQLIGRNADFKEAFAAVGRAISGEEPVGSSLQDAYTAVFNPSARSQQETGAEDPDPLPAVEDQEASPAQTAPSSPSDGQTGGRLVRYVGLPAADAPLVSGPLQSPVAGVPSESGASSEALSYVYTMPAPPENASLEQRNLGFDHCTPVRGVLTSSFGWREHPVEGGNKFHYGVDLAADDGADIAAFADGTVYATGESSTLGNYIMLRHQGGYITLYGHCSKVTATGGAVSKGDKIAEVGSTGRTTGPHLHFELHDGDLYLNPIYYVEIG